jgi:hypothetical protein
VSEPFATLAALTAFAVRCAGFTPRSNRSALAIVPFAIFPPVTAFTPTSGVVTPLATMSPESTVFVPVSACALPVRARNTAT